MTIGEYIHKIREDRGMLLRDVAEKSGYSISEISRVESGKRLKPSPGVLRALAGALLADYDDLMKRTGYGGEVCDDGNTFDKVFKNTETGEVMDATRGSKRMLDTDEEWANLAFRASCNLSCESRQVLACLVRAYLEYDWKKNHRKITGMNYREQKAGICRNQKKKTRTV